MVKLELNDTVTREIGKAGEFTVNLADMPEASLQYIFAYGLKQVLADAHSQAKNADEAKAMTGKKLDALMRGEFRVSSSRTSDPVMAEAKRLANVEFKKYSKNAVEAAVAKLKAKDESFTEADCIAAIKQALVAKMKPQAEQNVAALKAISEGLDLDDLV